MIGFNKPYLTGRELEYIGEAIKLDKLSSNGTYTQRCHKFFEDRYGFKKVLLTQSCTAALEMCALLLDLKPGDEVIVPSYTFVSTANAFLLNGAKIVFADSNEYNPNVDIDSIQNVITKQTKAIVVVHYAGFACDMQPVMELAKVHNLIVVEDAAQAIDSFYNNKPLGSIGHLAAFSFHETKNIISGEGGMLVINDDRFLTRSEIIWEKGTNRAEFLRGSVNKYNWVDIGSSFSPSEITAAFLYAQLEQLDTIQEKRKLIWNHYNQYFTKNLPNLIIHKTESFTSNNGHLFYLLMDNKMMRDELLTYLNQNDIQAIFHYLPLHLSPFYKNLNKTIPHLPNAERYGDCLIRIPFYAGMTQNDIDTVERSVSQFFT